MPGFHLTQAAKTDLKDIGRYTQNKWGRAQRDKYLAMLDGCFQDLADEPLKGRDCSDIRDGYRKYSAGRHVIFYHQIPIDTIEIVRILHDRMDVERHRTKPPLAPARRESTQAGSSASVNSA